jgi:hypothetical protein
MSINANIHMMNGDRATYDETSVPYLKLGDGAVLFLHTRAAAQSLADAARKAVEWHEAHPRVGP